ncbi:ABC transporter substrate-binding protein [Rhodovibrionaceae bacterium A322]
MRKATRLSSMLLAGILLSSPALADKETLEPPASTASEFKQAPILEQLVSDGALPPLNKRLPSNPLMVPETDFRGPGTYGGGLTMLVGKPKDLKIFAVYGYARLVGYTEEFKLQPDVLAKVDIEDGRIFTLHLRKGHRWSNGDPFTTEDLRYYWEDVANNPELSPSGPPKLLLVDGKPPVVEVLDETTIRYSWDSPNPFFLPSLARARPLYIYKPSTYLKQFHKNYVAEAELAERMEKARAHNWAALHNSLDNPYRFDNPDLPTLQPWYLTTPPPTRRFVSKRNPYFHRIDSQGQQLPYLDEFVLRITASPLIVPKTATGESDLQSRGINFNDITILKTKEEEANLKVTLWNTMRASQQALYPNLNAKDPVWRKVIRDVRFRRALSLATDRELINETIFFGVGQPGNQSALEGSELYDEELRMAWADYDIDQANALLDEMGLTEKDSDGIRLLPDGRQMEIIVETAGENVQESDILELIAPSWQEIGIKIFAKPSQRDVLRNRIFSGATIMSIYNGLENGLLSVDLPPSEFTPVSQYLLQWPMWGQYFDTSGNSGEAVDTPEGKRLMELYEAWTRASSRADREAAWREILQIYSEQVYSIGLVAMVPQPVARHKDLMNVPDTGIYNWDPGAQLGVYHMDAFYWAK